MLLLPYHTHIPHSRKSSAGPLDLLLFDQTGSIYYQSKVQLQSGGGVKDMDLSWSQFKEPVAKPVSRKVAQLSMQGQYPHYSQFIQSRNWKYYFYLWSGKCTLMLKFQREIKKMAVAILVTDNSTQDPTTDSKKRGIISAVAWLQ